MSDTTTQTVQTAEDTMTLFAEKATPHTEADRDRLEAAIEWQSDERANDWGIIQAKGIEFSFAVPLANWPDIITEDVNRAVENAAQHVATETVEALADVADVTEMDAGANAYARITYNPKLAAIVVVFQLDVDARFRRN